MAKIKKIETEIPWDHSYKRLSASLQSFYNKHKKKSPLVLYDLVARESKLIASQNWFKNTGSYNSKGIDPVQVYTSFSSYKSRIPFRIELLNEWLRILKADVQYSRIDFAGCPTPFSIKILWGRPMEQQVEIWEEFSQIFLFDEKALKDDLFKKVVTWQGIQLTSFSIFLFWINSDKYISLDKNTVSFLLKNLKTFSSPENFQDYIKLLNSIPAKLNKAIVSVAYNAEAINSLEPNQRAALQKFIGGITYIGSKDREINSAIDFRLIGIKLTAKLQESYRKSLKPGYYSFYEGYSWKHNKIILDKDKLVDIYCEDGLRISLNAIVGKNGSGKSAVSELLFMAVNNLYFKYLKVDKPKDVDWIKDLNLEIFFESYGVFQIICKSDDVKVYEYINTGKNIYERSPEKVQINRSFLEKFFYTISVNYSLYGLNSRHNRDWLEKLFVKNDGYENPIVFEPNREDGNINIHRQEELLRSRFLANTVDFVSEELLVPNKKWKNSDSFRYIRDKIELKNITLAFNPSKTSVIFKTKKNKVIISPGQIKGYQTLISSIQKEYKLNKIKLSTIDFLGNSDWRSIALRYLVKKILKIALTYSPYKELHWDKEAEILIDIPGFIAQLKTDETHITNKIRQTLNYLDGRIIYLEETYSLDELVNLINDSQKKHKGFNDKDLETIELLPPPFFNTSLKIKDSTVSARGKLFPFEHLSSGERQQIYSLNSILYHLKNIDSIDFGQRIKYRCVNLMLDEIELYAHPEMQRVYINELLKIINKTSWSNLISINICFITHSPFILSDIPSERIMFLSQNGNQENDVKTKTFGANIHELLMDGFFLSNTIGEFALKNINEIIKFHSKIMNSSPLDFEANKSDYNKRKHLFHYILKSIGETYIRGILKNHISDIEKLLNDTDYKRKELEDLENKIRNLRKEINA